jgi:hypothetical protein
MRARPSWGRPPSRSAEQRATTPATKLTVATDVGSKQRLGVVVAPRRGQAGERAQHRQARQRREQRHVAARQEGVGVARGLSEIATEEPAFRHQRQPGVAGGGAGGDGPVDEHPEGAD